MTRDTRLIAVLAVAVMALIFGLSLVLALQAIPAGSTSLRIPTALVSGLFVAVVAGIAIFDAVSARRKGLWFLHGHPLYAFVAKFVVVGLILIGAVIAAWEFATFAPQSHTEILGPISIIFTGVLATIGWNYTAYENRRAEMRRCTVQLIEKLNENAMHQRLKSELWLALPKSGQPTEATLYDSYSTLYRTTGYADCVEYFLTGKRLEPPSSRMQPSSDEPGQFEKSKRIYAVGTYCDVLEWMALQIRMHRLDEPMVREMLADVVRIVCQEFSEFIAQAQRENPEFYEHLSWLNERWRS
jgi:hypothetical protein